eukprot:COSAG05_NODE_674_length_7989_cov_2.918504_6_plen_69_part_00
MVVDAFRHQLVRVRIVHDVLVGSTLASRSPASSAALERQRTRSRTEQKTAAAIRGNAAHIAHCPDRSF